MADENAGSASVNLSTDSIEVVDTDIMEVDVVAQDLAIPLPNVISPIRPSAIIEDPCVVFNPVSASTPERDFAPARVSTTPMPVSMQV